MKIGNASNVTIKSPTGLNRAINAASKRLTMTEFILNLSSLQTRRRKNTSKRAIARSVANQKNRSVYQLASNACKRSQSQRRGSAPSVTKKRGSNTMQIVNLVV